jgi:hypothetical protein
VIEGGDHAVSEFEQYVDEVLAFCGVETETATRAVAGSDLGQ